MVMKDGVWYFEVVDLVCVGCNFCMYVCLVE